MTLLDSLRGPRDLKDLEPDKLTALAAQIRERLISTVSENSGHLGPNLGVVELTIALHRVFDSPRDPLIFDTGHQSYVHKLLTGRQAEFATLRQPGGMSGYPSRAESPHDHVENSHASTSLSYADGLAKAFRLRGESDRTVVAIIGDGALTGGMAWEALNNIAAAKTSRVVIVVNDNGRSYSPTHGAIATHLAQVRTTRRYEDFLAFVKTTVPRAPLVGAPLYEALHGIKEGLKDVLQPQVLFQDLGLKYVGPVDGHDESAVERALAHAQGFGGPVLVHVITRKGRGYEPAENNDEDCLHQVAAGTDPLTGAPMKAAARTWSHVFAEEMARIGGQRRDVVAITAAMLHPTGLAPFAQAYPDRCFDVGIAEQHAVTSAAGLAMGGLHPVVALYSTFLNRAFDQVLTDVALHRLPVTFVLDRAGVTGPDGASHHGMWDGSIGQLVPGLRIAAPRDARRLAELLAEALDDADGPTMLRFPKAPACDEIPGRGSLGGMDIVAQPSEGAEVDVLLAGAGVMAGVSAEVARRLAEQGIGALAVDPRWVKPVDPALATAARQARLVVTVEDNGIAGGFGDAVARTLRQAGVLTPVMPFGLPQEFLAHGTRDGILEQAGLTSQHIARSVTEAISDSKQQPAMAGVRDRGRVILAEPHGFCAGVRRAIDIVERALEIHGAPVYVRKQIVHNDYVVRQLEARGARFVDSETEVPEGAVCIFSAHGVSPQVRANAAERHLTVIDATCPLVAKVHQEARRYARDERTLILIGHADHEEIEGTYGEAPERTVIVENADEARRLELLPGTAAAYLTQTTLSVDETAEIVSVLRERFPDLEGPGSEDICYASQNRQNAVKAIAKRSELVLVVGSASSSNSIRMVEVARAAGTRALLLSGPDQLRREWLADVRAVGVSAGASTPEVLVEQVIERLGSFGFTDVKTEVTARETVVFSPPSGLGHVRQQANLSTGEDDHRW